MTHLVYEETSLANATWLGPVRLDAELSAESLTEFAETRDSLFGVAQATSAVSVPLVRRFGTTTVHWLEPKVFVSAAFAGNTTSAPANALSERERLVGANGVAALALDSRLGWERTSSFIVELRAGAIAHAALPELDSGAAAALDEHVELFTPAFALRGSLDAGGLYSDVRVATLPGLARAIVGSGRLGAGNPSGGRIGIRSDFRSRSDERAQAAAFGMRRLAAQNWQLLFADWYAETVWSGGLELSAPWGANLASEVNALADLSRRRVLGASHSLVYSHPCRCFSLEAKVGARLGRQGVDALVGLSLFP